MDLRKLLINALYVVCIIGGSSGTEVAFAKTQTIEIDEGLISISHRIDPDISFLGLSLEVVCQSRKISLAGSWQDIKIVQSSPCRDFEVKGPGVSLVSEIHAEGTLPSADGFEFQSPPMLVVFDKGFLGANLVCLAFNAHFYDVASDRSFVKRLPTYCTNTKLPKWWDGSRGITYVDNLLSVLSTDIRDNYFEVTYIKRNGIDIKISKRPKF